MQSSLLEEVKIEEADSSSEQDYQSIKLESYSGLKNFKVEVLNEDNVQAKSERKWQYSKEMKKIFTCPNTSFPINISITPWCHNASVTITPVYKNSEDLHKPVHRCYNCKMNDHYSINQQQIEHIIRVEGTGAEYNHDPVTNRYSVSFPLSYPQLGSDSSLVLVKSMCLTSCVGGPNRRPFVLLFTLKVDDILVGKQVIDLKCSKCPKRDMIKDREKLNNSTNSTSVSSPNLVNLSNSIDSFMQHLQPPAAPVNILSSVQSLPKNEVKYTKIQVPREFLEEVKEYTNYLVAKKHTRSNNSDMFLYPE